jgi:hypothetical protein
MHYKSSENNTELGLRSNLGVPTGYQIMLNLGVKTNTRTDFISGVLKSFSVCVSVSVILILTLKTIAKCRCKTRCNANTNKTPTLK